MITRASCIDCGLVPAKRITARVDNGITAQRVCCFMCGNIFWEILLPALPRTDDEEVVVS